MQETQVQAVGEEGPLEEEMATHSSILAWEIPSTEEPGGLQSLGSQKRWTRLRDQTATTVKSLERLFSELKTGLRLRAD